MRLDFACICSFLVWISIRNLAATRTQEMDINTKPCSDKDSRNAVSVEHIEPVDGKTVRCPVGGEEGSMTGKRGTQKATYKEALMKRVAEI
jgi:hypothetical protein